MPITREDSYIVEGTVRAVDFDRQVAVVKTTNGGDLKTVPISSSYMSVATKRGFHAFPKVGDKCWLVRDVDKWYISGFGPKGDLGGNLFTPKPKRYGAETIHVSSDINTVDLLPAAEGTGGLKPFAEQKYGLSTEVLGAVASGCGVPVSFTTLKNSPELTLSVLSSRMLGCDLCAVEIKPVEDVVTGTPRAITISRGAVLAQATETAVKQFKIVFEGDMTFFADGIYSAEDSSNPSNVIPEVPGVKLILSGLPVATYVLTTLPTDETPNLLFNLTVSTDLPEGAVDIELQNTKTGGCFKIPNAFSVHYFTPGTVTKTYFQTPANASIGFESATALSAPFTTNPPSVGAMFTVRDSIKSAILQMQDSNSPAIENVKYVGLPGPFPDFLAAYNVDGTKRIGSAATLNSYAKCHETLDTLRNTPGITFKATVTGIGASAAEIKSRLEASAISTRVFSGDDTNENMGVRLNNFLVTDRFRITVYRDIEKTAPNYDGISLLYSLTPDNIGEPIEIMLVLKAENIRFGSTYVLRRSTNLVFRETPDEAFQEILGAKAQFSLGCDSDQDEKALLFTDSDGNTPAPNLEEITGTAKTYRVSDETVGIRLKIDTFKGLLPPVVSGVPSQDIPYGDYDLLVSHPDQSGVSVLHNAIRITYDGIKTSASSSNGGTTADSTTSTKDNVVLQKVNTLDPETKEENTLFTYAVDETGRCDIVTKAGVYINGLNVGGDSTTTNLEGKTGKFRSNIKFSSEDGDGELITQDGNITIAAFKKNMEAKDKGDVRIHADSCLNAGQDSQIVFVGRRSRKSQYSTMSVEAHFGGLAKSMKKKFPAYYGFLNPVSESTKEAGEDILNAVVSVGPVLIPDEKQLFVAQQRVAVTPPRNEGEPATINKNTFSETFFSMRSRVTTPSGYLLEGRINLIFVPDGNGEGTDTSPFTGTWQIPLV